MIEARDVNQNGFAPGCRPRGAANLGGCAMRSDLRLTDLRRLTQPVSKLMNVKIPAHVSDAIHRVADSLGASITNVVIALLNEGLDRSAETLKDWRPRRIALPPPKRVCTLKGCSRAYVARGLCANHYQAARRRPRST